MPHARTKEMNKPMKLNKSTLAKIVAIPAQLLAVCAFAASEPLEGSKPDYVVYRPLQPRGGKNADPAKRGDCYNDHFQVIWDDARKLYYAFWTQGSGEGYGDMHVCLSKSADRGKTWTYPKLIAGGEKMSDPKPRAVWQQPMLAKSGRLYCLWNQQVNDERLHHGVVYGAYSDDAGETWSKPERNDSIPRQFRDDWKGISLPSWCNWQRPLRLAEGGRFLVACTRHGTGRGEPHRSLAIEFWRFENIDENPEIRDIRITVLSGGKDAIRVPAGDTGRFICEEAGIVKLPDGRLFALMRTRNRHPYWVQSRDNGVSWSKPEPLRDEKGEAYLHPCSPCPIYDVNGCEAASGEYVAFIHNAYDDSIPPLGRQKRGPVYMIRGRFDPKAHQPIVFGTPELFSAVKDGNSYYASFTHADGEGVMWFAHQKHFLIGRRIYPKGMK